jgi:hypothetical protein
MDRLPSLAIANKEVYICSFQPCTGEPIGVAQPAITKIDIGAIKSSRCNG